MSEDWIDAEAQTPSTEEAVLAEFGGRAIKARFIERNVAGYWWQAVDGSGIWRTRQWRPLEKP